MKKEIDVSKLDMICRCEGKSAIYEEGDYWVSTDYDGKNPERTNKSHNPYYPLSAVSKYDAEAVNVKRLEELGNELKQQLAGKK